MSLFSPYEILTANKLNLVLTDTLNQLLRDDLDAALSTKLDIVLPGKLDVILAAELNTVLSAKLTLLLPDALAAIFPGTNLLLGDGALSAVPTISYSPVANSPSTLGSLVVQGATAAGPTRQFLASFGLRSSHGHGTPGADKVAMYAAVDAFNGSSDVWAINTVTSMEAGLAADVNAQGYELDFNNMAQARGSGLGVAGLVADALAVGLTVTGASDYSSSTAILIGGVGPGQWNRGITVTACVGQSAFSDYSASPVGIQMQATHSQYGIDMQGSTLGGAIRVPYGTAIRSRNATNSADIDLITLSSVNNAVVGANANNVIFGAAPAPITDNTQSLGSSGLRFTALYAVNGTIQTSDETLKTDIQALPAALPIIGAINPVTFRWINGGYDEQDAGIDANGVQMKQRVAKSGSRTHWGFLAADVKAGFEKTGRDFGGYIKDTTTGLESLRPDQLVPVLWKAVQELAAKVANLEAAAAGSA
jgi:hypothetical protein